MGIGSIIIKTLVREGLKEVGRAYGENKRLEWRKLRLQQLGRVHVLVHQDFIKPPSDNISGLSSKDAERVNRRLVTMNERGEALLGDNADLSDAGVSRYATAIKLAAIMSISLCKKYGIYSGIESVKHDASRKMNLLNDHDHYSLI